MLKSPSTRFVLSVASALVLLWAAPAHSEEAAAGAESLLTSTLADYRTLALRSTGRPVAGETAEIGRLSLKLESGNAFPLTTKNGEVLGFYFEGVGKYVYRSEDAIDHQVIETNFTNRSKAALYRDGRISDRFERALVFFARPAFEAVWTVEDPGTGVGPAAAGKGFDRLWKRTMATYLEYDHLAAEARLNGGEHQFVYAEIEGQNEDVGYRFDRLRRFREQLFLFRKIAGYDIRFKEIVSTQLVDKGPHFNPTALRLKDARLDVETLDNRTGTIESDLTFEAQRGELRVVGLDLVSNLDPDSYDWSSERMKLQVTRVTDAEGAELPHSHRYNEILVELPAPVRAGETVQLHFESEGEVFTTMRGTHADNYFELSGFSWFPEPMGWPTNHDFRIRVKTRKPFAPISSGKTISLNEDDEYYELQAESVRPANRIAIFGGKYKTAEKQFDDLTIRIHGYAAARKGVMENMPNLAYAFIKFYEETLGAYPFDELDIVEVPEYGFGIAPSGMVLMTSEAYKPRQDFLASYFSRGVTSRLAHEVAHQWFGHIANPSTSRDNWIAESFAEYMSGLAMMALSQDGKKRNVQGFDEMFAEWRRASNECRDAGPIEAANMLTGPSSSRERFYLMYDRGPLVLRMLHTMIGNEKFFAVLQRFLKNAEAGSVTTADVQKASEQVLGGDNSWFFDQWVRHGGIPEIEITHKVGRAENGKSLLSGQAKLLAGDGFNMMLIPLLVDYGGGRREVKVIRMNEPVSDFVFELAARPKQIKVDPSNNTLAEYK